MSSLVLPLTSIFLNSFYILFVFAGMASKAEGSFLRVYGYEATSELQYVISTIFLLINKLYTAM